MKLYPSNARRGGAEVAGWTLDREDPGSIPRLPSPRVGPLMARRLKDVFGRPGARVEVGSARLRPLAAHGVGARQQVKIWKLDICPVTI